MVWEDEDALANTGDGRKGRGGVKRYWIETEWVWRGFAKMILQKKLILVVVGGREC